MGQVYRVDFALQLTGVVPNLCFSRSGKSSSVCELILEVADLTDLLRLMRKRGAARAWMNSAYRHTGT
jgi:hypothetical protein